MDKIKRGLAVVRWAYDFIIAQIGIHPEATFWLVLAYLVIRR